MKPYLFIPLTLCFLAACSPIPPLNVPTSQPKASGKVTLGQEFLLKVGETAMLESEDLKLTFAAVPEDSRCPSKVNCVWIGRAVLSLTGQKGAQEPVDFTLATIHSPDPTDRAVLEGYEVRLIALEPYPELPDEPIPAEAYRATLVVNRPAAEACPPRADDPTGYLTTICRHIQEQQINVSPADPAQYQIKSIEERTENGRKVVWVFLNCCYLGDIAIIDKETGEVIQFRVGAK